MVFEDMDAFFFRHGGYGTKPVRYLQIFDFLPPTGVYFISNNRHDGNVNEIRIELKEFVSDWLVLSLKNTDPEPR